MTLDASKMIIVDLYSGSLRYQESKIKQSGVNRILQQ